MARAERAICWVRTNGQSGETIPFFVDEQEVYRHIGKVFVDLMADEDLVPQLKRANTIVQYRLHDPDAQVTVKILEGEERQVDLGPTDLKPEVVMTMAADTARSTQRAPSALGPRSERILGRADSTHGMCERRRAARRPPCPRPR